jgi:hypothetical protein
LIQLEKATRKPLQTKLSGVDSMPLRHSKIRHKKATHATTVAVDEYQIRPAAPVSIFAEDGNGRRTFGD